MKGFSIAAALVLSVNLGLGLNPAFAADGSKSPSPAEAIAKATAKAKPAVAKRLVLDELKQLRTQREGLSTQEKSVDLSGLTADKDFEKAIAAVAANPKKVTLKDIEVAAEKLADEGNEQALYLLAAALKLAVRQEAFPGVGTGEIAQAILVDSLSVFGNGSDTSVQLPEPSQSKILSALQEQDRKEGVEPRTAITGGALRKYFEDPARSAALPTEEKVKIAAATNLAAARELSRYYLQRAAEQGAQQAERSNSGAWKPRAAQGGASAQKGAEPKTGGGNGAVCPAPGPHQNAASRQQPDLNGTGGSISGGSLPLVPDAADGRALLSPEQSRGLRVDPVEFSGNEVDGLTRAVSNRKSLTMEIGREFINQVTGRHSFSPQSLCQATVVHPADLPPFTRMGDSCRYVLASAKHCFEDLKLEDSITLAGFARPIDAAHRKVIVSGGEGEDFATMLVDAPCDSVSKDLPSDVLAPAGLLRASGGQAVVLDVQRTGERAVAGRTSPSRDRSFVGVSVAGQGKIFPGDSGGRMAVVDADGQTFFAGVTSSKFVDAAFRDAVGNVAVVPSWLRDGFHSGEFAQPLPASVLVKHLAPADNALLAARTH